MNEFTNFIMKLHGEYIGETRSYWVFRTYEDEDGSKRIPEHNLFRVIKGTMIDYTSYKRQETKTLIKRD